VDEFNLQAETELTVWKNRMLRKPSLVNQLTKGLQVRVNRIIPEKVHVAITSAIKQMIRTVTFGMKFATPKPLVEGTLQEREMRVDERIKFYSRTASVEGAVTGAGGILLGLADFPLWLTVKMKMLYEIAALYGYDVKDYKERVYLLHVFELTFSSQAHRRNVFAVMNNWPGYSQTLPDDIHQFDWRSFQQEYRDYIDLAKLLQLIPGIGAPIGAIVNLRLTRKLGAMAKNAYRMRLSQQAPGRLPQGNILAIHG
jgi:hypothetical protein